MSNPLLTRKEFLEAVAVAAALPAAMAAAAPGRKLLIVVAHPDDEYVFTAATYRLVREQGWTADQVIVTNGEAGYRYSSVAAAYYGVPLSRESLPQIRKDEALRAGKVLGIRRHYFLDQQDLGFNTDAAAASSVNWEHAKLLSYLSDLLARERYDVVLTMLPTAQTHGHHRAATLLALEAVAQMAEPDRPLVFGVEAVAHQDAPIGFEGLSGQSLTAVASAQPAIVVDRTAPLPQQPALNYQVVVNWVIAEHKSQGLFQMDAGRHDREEFWLFSVSGKGTKERLEELGADLNARGSLQNSQPQKEMVPSDPIPSSAHHRHARY